MPAEPAAVAAAPDAAAGPSSGERAAVPDLETLSLAQALRDFERANARVVDLTRRLLAAESRCRTLQAAADAGAAPKIIDVGRRIIRAGGRLFGQGLRAEPRPRP